MQTTNYQIVIIGGGIAGMQAAISLHNLGIKILLIEKEDKLGGHLNKYYKVFPNFKDAYIIVNQLANEIENLKIPVLVQTNITSIEEFKKSYIVNGISKNYHSQINNLFVSPKIDEIANKSQNDEAIDNFTCKAENVLFATGFENFDAKRKEEYGYGIYSNIITSLELEEEFKKPPKDNPKLIAFVHCVGSRDEKINNFHCSKVCCITAVKQAIELRERYPEAEIICLYMDLRMYDNGFEELYCEAQINHNILFIRGRLSEVSLNHDRKLVVKVQDTLAGVPMRITVDKLILMVGKEPSILPEFSPNISVNFASHGFILPADVHTDGNKTSQPGFFCCGTSSGPKTIRDTIADAQAAAFAVSEYLTKK